MMEWVFSEYLSPNRLVSYVSYMSYLVYIVFIITMIKNYYIPHAKKIRAALPKEGWTSIIVLFFQEESLLLLFTPIIIVSYIFPSTASNFGNNYKDVFSAFINIAAIAGALISLTIDKFLSGQRDDFASANISDIKKVLIRMQHGQSFKTLIVCIVSIIINFVLLIQLASNDQISNSGFWYIAWYISMMIFAVSFAKHLMVAIIISRAKMDI